MTPRPLLRCGEFFQHATTSGWCDRPKGHDDEHGPRRATDPPTTHCTHRPRKDDTDSGYSGCMFCIEEGGCDGKGGYCRDGGVLWDVWKDRMADARNSAF